MRKKIFEQLRAKVSELDEKREIAKCVLCHPRNLRTSEIIPPGFISYDVFWEHLEGNWTAQLQFPE